MQQFLSSKQIAGGTESFTAVLTPKEERISMNQGSPLIPVEYAGIYRSEDAAGNKRALFAVNLANMRESSIQPSKTLPLKSSKAISETTDGFRLGMEPWYFLIFLALVLTIVEWFLFHRRVIE